MVSDIISVPRDLFVLVSQDTHRRVHTHTHTLLSLSKYYSFTEYVNTSDGSSLGVTPDRPSFGFSWLPCQGQTSGRTSVDLFGCHVYLRLPTDDLLINNIPPSN